MKLAISYFYQIRFFKPYMIPVSTAVSDPQWYHNFQDKNYIFLDKRGIANGFRCELLHGDETCSGLCFGRKYCLDNPNNCLFLKQYRKQLDKINILDFLKETSNFAKRVKKWMGFKEEPMVVFIVHEAPSNKCSEREVLLKYFADNHIDCCELEYPINSRDQ